jgi:hypothetical protein
VDCGGIGDVGEEGSACAEDAPCCRWAVVEEDVDEVPVCREDLRCLKLLRWWRDDGECSCARAPLRCCGVCAVASWSRVTGPAEEEEEEEGGASSLCEPPCRSGEACFLLLRLLLLLLLRCRCSRFLVEDADVVELLIGALGAVWMCGSLLSASLFC